MKIKNIFILSMMAGMTLASCNYTDLSPQDSFTDKSYWKSANDLKMYANGIYSNMLAGPSSTLDGESDNFVTNSPSGYLFNNYTVPTSGGGWGWGNDELQYYTDSTENAALDGEGNREVN